MRIISGRLGGRIFAAPPGHATHPMSEKIRGALFNSLGDLHGLSMLDAFAGSGAISFEAISRGIKSVVSVDVDTPAFTTMRENAKTLKVSEEQCHIVQANCASWSRKNPDMRFDVVVVDPPFDANQGKYIQAFLMIKHVKPGGLLVVSMPPIEEVSRAYRLEAPDFKELSRKNYGDAELVFYRRFQ